MPRPIYTDPEIAGVGLTEARRARSYGDAVAVGMFPWVANARAVMSGTTAGWVKSIHETTYGELLGIVIVGPHATDLIEAGVVAIDAESTVETVADGIAPHPTLSEAIKEAGLVALGRAIHLHRRGADARLRQFHPKDDRHGDRWWYVRRMIRKRGTAAVAGLMAGEGLSLPRPRRSGTVFAGCSSSASRRRRGLRVAAEAGRRRRLGRLGAGRAGRAADAGRARTRAGADAGPEPVAT